MTTTVTTTLNLLAQASNPFGGLISTARGLLVAVGAGLLGLAVAAGVAVLCWRLLIGMFKDFSVEKLAMTVVACLAAVALLGATPGFVAAAYDFGQQMGNGSSGATAALTTEPGQ